MGSDLLNRSWMGLLAGVFAVIITIIALLLFGVSDVFFGTAVADALFVTVLISAAIGLSYALLIKPSNYGTALIGGLVLGIGLWLIQGFFMAEFVVVSLIGLLLYGIIMALSYNFANNLFMGYERFEKEKPYGAAGGEFLRKHGIGKKNNVDDEKKE